MLRTITLLKLLLWGAALFFFIEAVLHAFGLPILEHDKIWQVTSDGYIAIFALTYAALLAYVSTDITRHRTLFFMTMIGIALAMANGMYISASGGYSEFFPAKNLDGNITAIGVGMFIWYPLTWLAWWKKK